MLCIDNIRFWCKIQGFLDRINAPQTVLRIIIDDNFALPHLPGKTQKNTTNWQHHQIPPIELSPYQNIYKIQFALYREGELIGLGRTEFKFKQNRKDCLDVVDKEFRVAGKLVYELNWTNGAKLGNFIKYQQVTTAKNSSGGKQVVLTQKIKTQRQMNYVRKDNQEDDCSGGICACFAVRKKKKAQTPRMVQQPPKVSQRVQPIRIQPNVMTTPPLKMDSSNKPSVSTKFKNNPFVYFQQQLENGKDNDVQQLNRLCYYSKNIALSK